MAGESSVAALASYQWRVVYLFISDRFFSAAPEPLMDAVFVNRDLSSKETTVVVPPSPAPRVGAFHSFHKMGWP